MNHPELLIVPVLMLLDYFLTVLGAVWSEKKYQQHFKLEHYELNPLWQKSIAKKKWFNLKHFIIVAITTLCLLFISSQWNQPDDVFFEGFFGALTILFVSVVAIHISNLFIFFYISRHPDCVLGEVKMSYLLSLNLSQFRALTLIIPMIVIAIFSPTPFVIGGVGSQIGLFIVKYIWIAKAKAKKEKETPS